MRQTRRSSQGPHLGELVVVDEVGPVSVDERAERQAVLEARVEVLHVHVLVGRRLALAPEQEALLGGHLLDRDVLDGEPQDDGPDHAQRHLQVTVHDLCNRRRRVTSEEGDYDVSVGSGGRDTGGNDITIVEMLSELVKSLV